MKTVDFLDAIRKAYGLTSDYQLCKFMGWKAPRVSSYRQGRSAFDEYTCIQVAERLHLEPLYVLAAVAAERAQLPDVRSAWRKIADSVQKNAAKMAAGTILSLFMMAGQINGLVPVHSAPYVTDCILC